MMEHYYSASEARQQLGIQAGAFYYLIETGKIKKQVLPGKQRGVYSRHQIERLLQERSTINAIDKGTQKTAFLQATKDDLSEECELATFMLHGNAGYGLPSYTAWLDKNPATNFIIRDQGRIVAFMHVIPVKRDTIQRWMRGEIAAWEIRAEDIQVYTPGSSIECIIMGIATASDIDKQKRYQCGAHLMRGFLHFLQDLAKQNITMTRFYAMSATAEGNAILKRSKFVEKAHVKKHVIFELDPMSADTAMARAYRTGSAQGTIPTRGERGKS